MSRVLHKPEELSFDEYIFCSSCGDYVYEYCSIHGPLLVVPDDKVRTPTGFPPYVPHAALTIPRAFLHLAPSSVPGAGIGVFSSVALPRGVRFGPYRGVKRRRADSAYCWQIFDRQRAPAHVVDAADPARANWMRYVRCARAAPNLAAFQYRGQAYYRTVRVVPRFTELLVFCGSQCARAHGADTRHQPTTYPLTGLEAAIDDPKPSIDDREQTVDDPKPTIDYRKLTFDNRKLYACSISDSVLRTSSSLKRNSTIHTGIRPYECTVCSSKFSSSSNLTRHSRVHTGIRPYQCTVCNSKFSSCSDLTRHSRIHTGIKPYECTICSTKFCTSSQLKRHSRVHTGIKPYQCAICDFKSGSHSGLARHLRAHTGIKPYQCTACSAKFCTSSELKRHSSIHTGIKPYQCTICDFKFSTSSALGRHSNVHKGVKPYHCTICDSKFGTNHSLKRHLRTHASNCMPASQPPTPVTTLSQKSPF